jgi:hypothetical protein
MLGWTAHFAGAVRLPPKDRPTLLRVKKVPKTYLGKLKKVSQGLMADDRIGTRCSFVTIKTVATSLFIPREKKSGFSSMGER